MTGETHRVGGVLSALAGFSYLYSQGMLVNEVSPLLQFLIIYPFAIWGSVAPDLDHHEKSIPCRDLISRGINKLLHATTEDRRQAPASQRKTAAYKIAGFFDAKHRSWQTHSVALLVVSCLVLWWLGSCKGFFGTAVTPNWIIFRLIGIGIALGVASHMILDAITPSGIHILSLKLFKGVPSKLKLVPPANFFSTGGKWEMLVRALLWAGCGVCVVYLICNFWGIL